MDSKNTMSEPQSKPSLFDMIFLGIKFLIKKALFEPLGYEIHKKFNGYNQDGLRSIHNHEFMKDPSFKAAYERGMQAAEKDYNFHWRVHVALWVASQAMRLPGVFVECGVNRGFLSSAIMHSLDWSNTGKQFFLFDTFCGLVETLLNEDEKKMGRLSLNKTYVDCFEKVKENFKEFKNVQIVRGAVPDSLTQASILEVSYLSLDMNCAGPEIAAIEFFWPKMTKGGLVLLDDYAYFGYEPQKEAFDEFAKRNNIQILSLPTGQGLLIK